MILQPTLFDSEMVSQLRPLAPERCQLDDRSWVDQQPGWVADATAAFEDVLASTTWRQGTRILFDKEVVEPRLSGSVTRPSAHPWIDDVARALSDLYSVCFDTVFLNLYRTGDDAVAWHRDRIHRRQTQPVVAIITLGSARPFLMRPHGGGPSVRFRPLPGDLLVMGGRSQHEWEHCVPRTRRVTTPRLSVTLRPSRSLPG